MNKIFISMLALALSSTTSTFAAESGQGNKAQTSRMSQCSAEAKEKGLKGDERKEHMSQCLRSPGTQAAAKECNATATEKGLKGNKRKDFVSDCIKSKGSTTVG